MFSFLMKLMILGMVIMLFACSSKTQSLPDMTSAVTATMSPSGERILKANELAQRELLASRGDPDAAFEVAFHYSNEPDGKLKARQWLIIGAENGSPLAMHLLSGELFKEGGRINCERALFWLTKLSEHKDYVAGVSMASIEEQQRTIRDDVGRCR